MPNRFWKVSLMRSLICYSYSTYTCYVRLITLCAFAEGDLSLRFLASETGSGQRKKTAKRYASQATAGSRGRRVASRRGMVLISASN